MHQTGKDMAKRQRARFSPRDEQKQDKNVVELIRLPSDMKQYINSYRGK